MHDCVHRDSHTHTHTHTLHPQGCGVDGRAPSNPGVRLYLVDVPGLWAKHSAGREVRLETGFIDVLCPLWKRVKTKAYSSGCHPRPCEADRKSVV